MAKRNVTIQLDERVIREAKTLASRRGTSVSAMLAYEVERLVADDTRYQLARRRALQALDEAASAPPRRGGTAGANSARRP